MIYEDLYGVPFRMGGRDIHTGLDCYGFIIELVKRDGKELKDLLTIDNDINTAPDKIGKVNVREITESEIRAGDLVQCTWRNELHLAYILDKKTCVHMTYDGIKTSSILSLLNKKYFRVV